MTAPDDPVEQVKRILGEGHEAIEMVEHIRRYVEIAAGDVDPGRRAMAAEIKKLVRMPQSDVAQEEAGGIDVGAQWDSGHDQWVDEQNGVI